MGRLGVDFKWITLGVSGYWGQGLATKLGDTKSIPSTETTNNEYTKTRAGADLAVNTYIPSLGNLALKAEIIRGEDFKSDPFGFSMLVVQNIGDSFALFSRFDRYDPDLGKKNNAIDTIGGGFQYLFSNNFKGTAVYERPINEGSDVRDDFVTIQLQGMF